MKKSMVSSVAPVHSTSAIWKQFALFACVTFVQAMITKAIGEDPVIALGVILISEVFALNQVVVVQFAKVTFTWGLKCSFRFIVLSEIRLF
jgi:hypothetical protein